MELSVKLVTMPKSDIRTKILVLVIIIVAVLVVWGAGQDPLTAISVLLGSGLAGTQVARALVAGSATPSRV